MQTITHTAPAADFRAILARPVSRLDNLKRTYVEALAGLDHAERTCGAACRLLGNANRAARQIGLFGPAKRHEQAFAMRLVNRSRKALRAAEARSLRAVDALALWPGVAEAVRNGRG